MLEPESTLKTLSPHLILLMRKEGEEVDSGENETTQVAI